MGYICNATDLLWRCGDSLLLFSFELLSNFSKICFCHVIPQRFLNLIIKQMFYLFVSQDTLHVLHFVNNQRACYTKGKIKVCLCNIS